MDEGGARGALAPAYELALELEAAGLDQLELAERLGLPPAAVPSLLALAHAKAAAARSVVSSLKGSPPAGERTGEVEG